MDGQWDAKECAKKDKLAKLAYQGASQMHCIKSINTAVYTLISQLDISKEKSVERSEGEVFLTMTTFPRISPEGLQKAKMTIQLYPQNSPLQIWGLHFTKKYSQDIKWNKNTEIYLDIFTCTFQLVVTCLIKIRGNWRFSYAPLCQWTHRLWLSDVEGRWDWKEECRKKQ